MLTALIVGLLTALPFNELTSQNLVVNGGFEEYSFCPEFLDQLPRATGWSNARGTCDFLHSCGTPGVSGVPSSSFAYQDALSGNGYGAYLTYESTSSIENHREHMITELSTPLTIGETYYFSMYISRGFQSLFYNKASNGQGMMLSTSNFDADVNPSPPAGAANIVNYQVLEDTSSWVQVTGVIVAEEPYEHLLIGCFLEANELDTADTFGISEYGGAYYLVDEIRLSTDSAYVFENLVTSVRELDKDPLLVYPNPFSEMIGLAGIEAFSSYQLSDELGRIVRQSQIRSPEIQISDVASLQRGVYILTLIRTEGKNRQVRVIKY